jgi:hypothetical protein
MEERKHSKSRNRVILEKYIKSAKKKRVDLMKSPLKIIIAIALKIPTLIPPLAKIITTRRVKQVSFNLTPKDFR